MLDWTPGVVVGGDANTLLRCVSVPVSDYIYSANKALTL